MTMPNYEISKYNDHFPTYKLVEHDTDSWFIIVPERGGIMISLGIQGQELLYLDRDSFINKAANVRGGNPILFPICGPLNDGKYTWKDQAYSMKNHGIARNAAWEVVDTCSQDEASITLRLSSNDLTKHMFPFDFEIIFKYTLKDGELSINQTYTNASTQDMPFYAGFHPYFLTDTKQIAYDTDASTYFDYNDGRVKPYQDSIDLSESPESIVFLDALKPEISFSVNADTQIKLCYSEI
jgi:galactose mutarotase-like enzyme